MGFNPSKYKDN